MPSVQTIGLPESRNHSILRTKHQLLMCYLGSMSQIEEVLSLFISSLLSLVSSSTTASTPNLLATVLVFLDHLTGLLGVLAETNLRREGVKRDIL